MSERSYSFSSRSFGGAKLYIEETDELNFAHDWIHVVSSVRITQGCTLELYEGHNRIGLLDTITEDVWLLDDTNDMARSVSCTCEGKFWQS